MEAIGNNKKLIFVLSIALMVGIAFSMRWTYPLYIEKVSAGNFSFVPIRSAPSTATDDYFYYSHVREIIDGNIVSHDPLTYENKDKYTIHNTYSFSLLMCALGGLITGNTEHAYYFNYFFYPAINFIVIYMLIYILTQRIYMSALSSLFVVIFSLSVNPLAILNYLRTLGEGAFSDRIDVLSYTQLQRMPNILFTNIQLFVLTILLFFVIEKRSKSLLNHMALAFVLGISSSVSPQNFFISYAIYIISGLASLYIKDKKLIKSMLLVLFFSLLFAAPGLLMMRKASRLINEETVKFAIPGTEYLKFHLSEFVPKLKYLIPEFIFLYVFRFPYKRFILGEIAGIVAAFLFLAVTRGTYAGGRVLFRGAELLYAALFISGFMLIIIEAVRTKKIVIGLGRRDIYKINLKFGALNLFENKRYENLVRRFIITLSFSIVTMCILNQYHLIKKDIIHYDDKYFKQLYKWSMRFTKPDEVAVTLDFDLMTNLAVYSPLNLYTPQVMLSPASHEERYKRFYESLRLYGVSPNEFRYLLDKMISHCEMENLKDPVDVRLALMQLVLFYGRYCESPMPETDKEKMVREYVEVYKKKGLSFRSDYLIISKFDEEFIHDGSVVGAIVKEYSPIFQNNSYKVYSFLNKPVLTADYIKLKMRGLNEKTIYNR